MRDSSHGGFLMTGIGSGVMLDVEVYEIGRTSYSRDGVEVLKVRLLVKSEKEGSRTFTGWVYPDEIVLQSDPDAWNLHPDELKDLMGQAANDYCSRFEDWGTEILSREEPVGDKRP